jgi:hypothetical protein
MDLSIIIVNWNTRDLLAQCLQSVYDTVQGLAFEVFVVDNASTDGSADMVRGRFPGVQLIENAENVGFARANNQAMSSTTGRHILLLNPDTIVPPDAVSALSRCLDANPQAGVVGPQLLNMDGSLQESWAQFPGLVSEVPVLGRRLTQKPRGFKPAAGDAPSAWLVDWVSGACFMVKRAVLDSVGDFDESYWLYTEETDWCYRIWRAGWEVLFLPQVQIIHIARAASKQLYVRTFLQYHRSRFQFVRQHGGTIEATLLRGLVAAKSVLRLVWVKNSSLARLVPEQPVSAIRHAHWRLFKLCMGFEA